MSQPEGEKIVDGMTDSGWARLGNQWPVFAGAPLCDWERVPARLDGKEHKPIIVELFGAPLNPTWDPAAYPRRTITRSISFNDASAPEYDKVKDFNDQVSAVIVRPGPHYDPHRFYKVTLYSEWSYRGYLLALSLGVYPDLDRFNFGDITSSVKFEQGFLADFADEEDYAAARSYYESNV